MNRGRGAATMVPVDDQVTDEERAAGRGTRQRRNLAQRLADAQREINEMKWGGVKEAATLIGTVVEALEGTEKDELGNINNQLVDLLRANGQEISV